MFEVTGYSYVAELKLGPDFRVMILSSVQKGDVGHSQG